MNEYVGLSYQEKEQIKLPIYKQFEDQKRKELGDIKYEILATRNLQEFIHKQKEHVERRFTEEKYGLKKKMSEQNWIEKYRPNYFAEIVSQDMAVKKVKEFIESFFRFTGENLSFQKLSKSLGKSRKNAVLLYGPPGTGRSEERRVGKEG